MDVVCSKARKSVYDTMTIVHAVWICLYMQYNEKVKTINKQVSSIKLQCNCDSPVSYIIIPLISDMVVIESSVVVLGAAPQDCL